MRNSRYHVTFSVLYLCTAAGFAFDIVADGAWAACGTALFISGMFLWMSRE